LNGNEDEKVKELKRKGVDYLEKEYINEHESMAETKRPEETPSKKIKLTNKEHVEEQGVRFYMDLNDFTFLFNYFYRNQCQFM